MKTPSDSLYKLIQTLTPAEKKFFKRVSNKYNTSRKNYNLELFEATNKLVLSEELTAYDESKLVAALKSRKLVKDLHVYKNRLYREILKVLRMKEMDQNIHSQLYEQLEHAMLLRRRGLIKEALKEIDQLIDKATQYESDFVKLEALSIRQGLMSLNSAEQKDLWNSLNSNFEEQRSILLNRVQCIDYIESGWSLTEQIKSAPEIIQGDDLNTLNNILKKLEPKPPASFKMANTIRYAALALYNDALKNLEKAGEYTQASYQIFENNPELQDAYPKTYLKAISNFLIAKTYLNDFIIVEQTLKKAMLSKTRKYWTLDVQLGALFLERKLIRQLHLANYPTDLKTKEEPIISIENSERAGVLAALYLEFHSCCEYYFILEDYERLLDYTKRLEELNFAPIRDVHLIASKLYTIVVHLEQQNFTLIPYLIEQTRYYLKKKGLYNENYQLLLRFMHNYQMRKASEIEKAYLTIKDMEDLPPLILTWLRAKIKGEKMLVVYRSTLEG